MWLLSIVCTRYPLLSFTDTATTGISTLSLHDALPISRFCVECGAPLAAGPAAVRRIRRRISRSEEHTSELQSHSDLVCRLLLEEKKRTLAPTRNSHRTCTYRATRRAASSPNDLRTHRP